MKKFRTLKIQKSQGCLVDLLNILKSSKKSTYTYQKKLTEDYAKNIFVDVNNVACFKTKRKSLFESCVWLLASNDTLTVTNITSSSNHQLGITNYNFILMSFFNDFIRPYLDETFRVEISGEEISLQEMLNEETFNFLIGLNVQRMAYPKTDICVVEGYNRKNEHILVIWRDCTKVSNTDLNDFFKKMDYSTRDREFDRIYVNGDNNLENLKTDADTWKVTLIEQEFSKKMFEEA